MTSKRGAADKTQERMTGNQIGIRSTSNQMFDSAHTNQRRENSKLGSVLLPPASFRNASRMDLFDFSTAICVAETGSFHKAAKVLSIGQPAVSRRVARLEDVLGVSLFERHSTGAKLTHAGERLVSQMLPIFKELGVVIETAQTAGVAGNGHLNIGLIASLSRGIVREVIEAFIADHTGIDLCFVEADRSSLMTMLNHRTVDVVIASGEPVPEFGDGYVLDWEEVYLAVSNNNPLSKQTCLTWSDVSGSTFVVAASEPGPEIHDYIIRRASDFGCSAHVQRHKLDREGIMNLVGLGLGVSLVADHWRGVRYPNVAFIPMGDEEERVPFSLTWRPENDNPALRRFVSLARVHARTAAAGDAASQRPDPSP